MKILFFCLLGFFFSFNSFSLEKAPGGCSSVKGLCKFFYEENATGAKRCMPIPGNRIKGKAEHCQAGVIYKKP